MANEKRLIDANALWAEAMEYADTGIEFDGEGVANFIANAPTVCVVEVTTSCEDPNTEYITFPDDLRLIIRDGEYAGWYVCK